MSDPSPSPVAPQVDAVQVAENASALRARLDDLGGRDVAILAVTKAFPLDAVRAAVGAGLNAVGENYAQELVAKAEELTQGEPLEGVEWHFVGQLQSRRIPALAAVGPVWQSVDRVKVARRIAALAPGAEIFIQVNATAESQKAGCAPGDAEELVATATDLGLHVRGLMTVGRIGDPTATSAAFHLVRDLADALGLAECSMGMTADLELAVDAGSTMVRVGRALFGERPPRN